MKDYEFNYQCAPTPATTTTRLCFCGAWTAWPNLSPPPPPTAMLRSATRSNSCDACDLVKFDFSAARITVDNFDGQGKASRSSPNEIRYSQVATYQGRNIDLVITSRKSYDCGDANVDACMAGGGYSAPHWGGIGVRRGSGRELYGRITLRYTDTNAEAVLPAFCLTFVDLGRGDGPIEYLTVGGYGSAGGQGTIFSSYVLGAEVRLDSGLSLWGRPALRFRATSRNPQTQSRSGRWSLAQIRRRRACACTSRILHRSTLCSERSTKEAAANECGLRAILISMDRVISR